MAANVWQRIVYAFDGDGNRTKQATSGCLTEHFLYDGANVVLDLNASNQVVHAYVNGLGIDQPVERIDFLNGTQLSALSSRLVYHTDALGSVVAMTDSGQQTAKSYSYEVFGKIRSETGSLVINRYTFTGREAVGDSLGFYYYRWRVMEPGVGRFTSEDLLGFVDGPTRYVYALIRPVDLVDPYGLSSGGGADDPSLKAIKQLLKGLKEAWELERKGKCPGDPCRIPSSIAEICSCLWDGLHHANPDPKELASCICQASSAPASECEAKWMKTIKSIFPWVK